MISNEDIRRWGGKELVDPAGEKIGTVEDFYLEKDTMEPEWVIVKRFRGLSEKLVPFRSVEWREDYAISRYDKKQVHDSPGPGMDGRLSDEEELELFEHYKLSRTEPLRPEGMTPVQAEQAGKEEWDRSQREHAYEHDPARAERVNREHDRVRAEEQARQAHPFSADLEDEEGEGEPSGEEVQGSSRLVRVRKYAVTERTERIPISDEEFEERGEEDEKRRAA